ncbi:MAG: NAD-dependent epimerase/dehydratase family protein [Hyphomicrobiaceae bacterium]|nr:NAD-dependent epimerase/dehydratase family protein [Hyphomicrobiaceae bacterium]
MSSHSAQSRVEDLNWLITGGCGFIGRALISDLMARGVPTGRIRILDNLTVGRSEDLAKVAPHRNDGDWTTAAAGIGLFVGDIRDGSATQRAASGADVIVHLAACTGVQPSVEDPRFDCETNVMGTLNCLEAARTGGARRFIMASSGAPLGDVEPPIHENLVARPVSPYGASKLAGEAYCSAYYHCFGIETVALRFGNVYGPLSTHKSSIVAKFTRNALDGHPLEIYGDGTASRDYIFVGDLADAIARAATVPDLGGEVFQIATARETTVAEVTEALRAVLKSRGVPDIEVIYSAKRKGDMPRNYSDTTKARERLQWTARTPLATGLERTVDWFLQQRKSA